MLRKKVMAIFVGAIFGICALPTAFALPIQFIYTGTGSGSIGENSFSTAAFTITQFADTANLSSCGSGCSFINANSTTVAISGIGTYDFITDTRTFHNGSIVGFSRAGSTGLDLYGYFNVGSTYDMMSSIGPISSTTYLMQWSSLDVTNGGILKFTNSTTQGTFQAIASRVPEPASLALLGLGLAGLAVTRRRKAA